MHRHELFGVQRSGLEQDRVRHADLADVVDEPASIQRVEIGGRESHPRTDPSCRFGDPLRVRLGVRVFRLDRGRKRKDHVLGAVQRVVGALQPQS